MQELNAGVIVFSIFIIVGFAFSMEFREESIHPLELTLIHLEEIESTDDTQIIQNHIHEVNTQIDKIWDNLPENKNPVWIFPTESTNFVRIQNDLDIMTKSVEKISTLPSDSSAYHTGILDVRQHASILQENILDSIPYMYGTITIAFFNSIWIVGAIGLVETIIRKSS